MKKLIFLCFLFPVLAFAQSPELIHVHFDKTFYVSGENVWFKIYFLNEDMAAIQSKVVHIDLFSEEGTVKIHRKLKIEGRTAHGDFFIPFDWKTENYTFRAYTLWNLNFEEDFIFEKELPIYSAFEKEKTLVKEKIKKKEQTTISPLKIKITTNKAVYKKREPITIQLKVTNASDKPVQANLSLSVYDLTLLPKEETTILTTKNSYISLDKTAFSQKYEHQKELYLLGELRDQKTNKIQPTGLYSIYLIENQQSIWSTSKDGNIGEKVELFEGKCTMQIFDLDPFHAVVPKVKLITIPTLISFYPVIPLDFPDSLRQKYIALAAKRQKINQLFDLAPDFATLPTVKQQDRLVPDKKVELKDYVGFNDIETFLSEVSTAKFKTKKEQKSYRMLNTETNQRFLKNPLLKINNHLTFESDVLFTLDFDEIEKIELFTGTFTIRKEWSVLGRNGVISISTKDGKIPAVIKTAPNIFTYEGIYTPRQFKQSLSTKNTPNFNPLMYWNPVVETDENGTATLTFSSLDALSQFSVYIEGIDEKGNVGIGAIEFEVGF